MSERSLSYEAVIVHKDVHGAEMMLTKEKQVRQIKDQFLAANIFDLNALDRESNAQRIIGGMGHGENTVEGYNNSLKNANRAGGREKIDEADLDKLADAAALAVIESRIADVQDDSVLGGLDRHLPDALKGLEGRVQKRMISCEQLVPIAQEMRDLREIFDLNTSSGRKSYNERTVQLLQETAQLNRRLRGTSYELEWKTLMAYLAQERERSENEGQQRAPQHSQRETPVNKNRQDEVDDSIDDVLSDEEKKLVAGMDRDQKEVFLKMKKELARRKFGREYPEDVDGMTKRAREILNFLEGTGYHSNSIEIAGETTRILNRMLADIGSKPELAELGREINTRLCLHDTSVFMENASGSFSKDGFSVGRAIGMIGENRRFLQRDHLKFLFQDGCGGVPFAQAWDLLEEANFNYYGLLENERVEKGIKRDIFNGNCVLLETKMMLELDMVKADSEKERDKIQQTITLIDQKLVTGWVEYEEDGTTVKKVHESREPYNPFDKFYDPKFGNYENEQKSTVKSAVEEYITRRLMEESGVDRIKAKKALQFAQKFVVASSEASVLNYAYAYGDNFSELIQFGRFREDENKPLKQKNGGPNIHRGYIKSINAGWLRNFCGIDDPDLMVTSKTIVDHLGVLEGKLVWSGYYGSFLFPKFLPASQALMNSKPLKPEEAIDINFIKQNVDVFNKSDPKNKKHLKAYWIAGLLQTTLDQHMCPWTSYDIDRFKDLVTNQPLSLPGEKVSSVLLSKEEWKWIEEELGLKWLTFLKGLGNGIRKIGSHRR